ncbi:unnamed protein product [Orchesella dallaii]|uniref:C-type lectin domain-containing protein n=1 Tax=Orchesella dallaii TaxID=48710 RepID=A0ABP1PMM5_9HEXA
MKTFLVALILGSSMMIASPRTLRLDISTKPELNTNTTATFPIRNTTLVTIGTFGGISYFVDGVPRNWNDSKSFCESHEAHLAKFDNKDQLQFLRRAVLNLGSEQWLWVSSTGEYEELRFVNLDGHCPALPPNFIFGLIRRRCNYKFFSLCQTADSGELHVTPDSIGKAESGKDENNGTKSDENIRSITESTSVNKTSINQLCEILNVNNTNSTVPTAPPTPKPTLIWIGSFRGKSYFGDRIFRIWSESKSLCENHGLELAEIDNNDELQFLRNTVRAVVYQEWSWVSNMGDYEVNKNCRKPSGYCPVLGPYGQGYLRRSCSDRRFGLCQTVGSSEEYFTPGLSREDESEEMQTTTESTKDIEKAVNQEKSKSEVFFQLLRDSFPWSSLQAITKGIPVVMGDYSAFEVIQESES